MSLFDDDSCDDESDVVSKETNKIEELWRNAREQEQSMVMTANKSPQRVAHRVPSSVKTPEDKLEAQVAIAAALQASSRIKSSGIPRKPIPPPIPSRPILKAKSAASSVALRPLVELKDVNEYITKEISEGKTNTSLFDDD